MNDQRIVLITGATRGIGRALAERLIDMGHAVVACGRSRSAIDELASRHASPHRFDAVDVASDTAVQAWAGRVLATGNPPDLLVNNAGVINANANLWDVPAKEFDALMQINVGGMANVIRAFLPAMIERGHGVVVNMSSGWGRSAAPDVAPYCASKWAIEGMTLALSQELPAGLAAVAVNPGVIDTDMLRSVWGDGAASFAGPDEWAARAADFLLALSARDNGSSVSI